MKKKLKMRIPPKIIKQKKRKKNSLSKNNKIKIKNKPHNLQISLKVSKLLNQTFY